MNLFKKHIQGPGGIQEILKISLPMIISQASEGLMMLTDRFFLSTINKVYPIAAMAGGSTSFLFILFFVGVVGYTTALVAQNMGAKKYNDCSLSVFQSFIIAIFFTPIIIGYGRYLAPIYFEWTGIDLEEKKYALQYFNIVNLSAFFLLIRVALAGFFSGIGKTRIVMFANVIGLLANVVLNYLFIYGKMGDQLSGINGAAYATLISGLLMPVILLGAYFRKQNRQKFSILKSFKFDTKTILKLIRFGGPTGIEFFLMFFAINTFVNFFHSYGTNEAVAITIAFNWDMLSIVFIWGINLGLMGQAGRYLGAKKVKLAMRSTGSAIKLGLLFTVPLTILILFKVDWPISVFLHEGISKDPAYDQILYLSRAMLYSVGFYCILNTSRSILAAFLRVAGDTLWSMYISLICNWAMLFMAYLAIKVYHWKPLSSWGLFVSMILIMSILFILRFFQGKWKEINVI